VCYDHRDSNETCTSKGTCVFTPTVYGVDLVLDEDKQAADGFCRGNSEYQSYANGNAQLGMSSACKLLTFRAAFKLDSYPEPAVGDDKCFDKNAEGSLSKCLGEYQSAGQLSYVIFMIIMWPIQVVAAYVGWVLPDL